MRYPTLKLEDMTPRQREVAAVIAKSGTDPLAGHQSALLYSPEVAERVQLLSEELRVNLRVPERLRALAVLVTAGRHRSADTVPFVRQDDVQQSGLAAATITALSEGRRPTDLKDDEALVYNFCTELMQTGRVRNVTFEALASRVGREICLELVHVCGYTAFLTTVLNVTQTTLSRTDG